MCGILAVIGDYRYKEIPKALLERGRDDNGIYQDKHVQLIQTRLEITKCNIELPYQTDRYVLLFNGEIYNYKQFGDNEYEAILNVYQYGGELDGQYAIIVYDKQTKEVTTLTDSFGIHCLYKDDYNGSRFYSSNLRSLPKIEFKEAQHRGYGNITKQRVL
jgi:asparagine synthase (glutamine-hydrolysing)